VVVVELLPVGSPKLQPFTIFSVCCPFQICGDGCGEMGSVSVCGVGEGVGKPCSWCCAPCTSRVRPTQGQLDRQLDRQASVVWAGVPSSLPKLLHSAAPVQHTAASRVAAHLGGLHVSAVHEVLQESGQVAQQQQQQQQSEQPRGKGSSAVQCSAVQCMPS
jgi:hypothetical protein